MTEPTMTYTVWITRTLPGAEDTAAVVAELGMIPVVAPLLEVVATDVPPAPAGHDIAFTSPNGVRHYQGPTDTTAWCVGAATGRAAQDAGFADVRVGPGDVAGLTDLLLGDLDRPLIHWAGAHVRGALTETLVEAGFEAQRVTAYRAEAVDALPINEPVDVVLLHSPRAAEVFADLARTHGAPLAGASIAISPAADAPLATIAGLTRWVATTPDEPGMLEALARYRYERDAMTETDEIAQPDSDEPFATPVARPVERVEPSRARGVGLGVVAGLSALAALAGAGGGYALTQLHGSTVAQGELEPALSTLRTDVATLRRAQTSLAQQVGDLERGPDAARLQDEIERLATRLAIVEADMVEAANGSSAVDAVADTEALAQLRTRLDALEDSRGLPVEPGGSDLRDSVTPAPALTPALARRLGDLETRLSALEASRTRIPTPTAEPTARPRPQVDPRPQVEMAAPPPLPAFPYDDVEAALDNPDDSSAAGRALRRFVRVRRVDTGEALDDLRAALDADDPRLALAAFSRLPDAAQDAARDWEQAARARLATDRPDPVQDPIQE